MSEEVEKPESGGKSFKGIIITLVSTITLGVGGFVTNKLTGGGGKEEEKPAAQPVINIQNTQTQQQAAGGKTVIINKAAEPAKPAQAQPAKPKKDGDEFKEKPAQW